MSGVFHRFEITAGGYLLLALLVFMLDAQLLLILLGNVCIHEGGHLWMLRRCGAYVRRVTLSGSGLCIRCSTYSLSARRMLLCAGAGPFAGMLGAVTVSLLGYYLSNPACYLFSGVGVVLSVFNLLPAKPLDGWQMLRAVSPVLANRVSVLTSVLAMCGGLTMMYLGYGTVFAMMGIFLLLQNESSGNITEFG